MAKRKVLIDEYENGSACKLYSYYLDLNQSFEFDDFLSHADIPENKKEIDKLLTVLSRITETNGALERYFRQEGKISDRIWALPVLSTKLRLYCIRVSEKILIVGNGGVKTSRSYQDDLYLNNCVETLQKIDHELFKLEKSNAISYYDKTIFDYPLELSIL